jgi:hypothetical protein
MKWDVVALRPKLVEQTKARTRANFGKIRPIESGSVPARHEAHFKDTLYSTFILASPTARNKGQVLSCHLASFAISYAVKKPHYGGYISHGRMSHGAASHERISYGCLMNVHLMGMYLMRIYFMGMHLMGVYLIGIYLMGMHLTGVQSQERVPMNSK